MFKNYLKTTWRSLKKNKGYSFLNIFGLAIGIACAGLIFLWVEDEMNFDDTQLKKDRIFLVRVNQAYDTYTSTFSSTPGVMGPALKQDIPGINNTCRVTEGSTSLLFSQGDNPVYASGKYVEASFFSMFSYHFVEGNAKNAFAQLYSIVITESASKKFFGNQKNVTGKNIRVDNKQDYIISGVIKDPAPNSTIQFEWLAPFEIYYQKSPWAQKWDNSCVNTYAELETKTNVETINKALFNYLPSKSPGSTSRLFMFSMNDWHLYDQFSNGKQTGGGRIEYVRMFSIIAWIILFIACINFMNLATSRSEKRAREVGVRKVLGAGKTKLVIQFIGEAMFLASLSGIAALIIISLALPYFNILVAKELTLALGNPLHIIGLALITFLCGLIAGSYPSFYLSSFNPVFVLKGIKLKSGSASYIRKVLVVLQFSVSIILIIATVIIYQQINHVKNRNLGFSKDNLVEMDVTGDMLKNYASIKQDLINTGTVENVALADHETIYGGNNTTSISWQGKNPNSIILISNRVVSKEYISVVNLKIAEGRDFVAADEVEFGDNFEPKDGVKNINIIVTKSLEKLLGNGSALGKTLQLEGNKQGEYFTLEIKGVVEDYVYGYMYGKPDPVIFYCFPDQTNLMYIRMKTGGNVDQALAKMASVLKIHNPAYPFDYKFVDEQFKAMFKSEMLISKLSRVFAFLAIVISCLGLFGLAAYATERRTKEIGIRKVLGATATGLAALLSKEFIALVIISCLVAFPVAWWSMSKWLLGYPYRIQISWWVFLIAGITAILIALFTVSFQAIKAALSNPVKSLRTE